ncbi:MAG: hydroxymethylglutaryl-CoA lyase [Thermoanaerobaculales bacterium]|jgi:hydroxymethylglutaryl-CoA lyase|nr:hydroxymethylglutaryl-CoA lyase [Thermoanaerobaculales bacterium]
MSDRPTRIIIEEQGVRDGFQSEKAVVPTERKLEIIDTLVEAGVSRIQICSFVHPKYVPQMADAEALCKAVKPRPGVIYSGLVLNQKGVERAVDAGLQHVAASISASDTHSRKNTGKSLDEAQAGYAAMVRTAKEAGLTVRGGLQCAFGCRFEGAVDPNLVLDLVKRHLDLDIDELALADSTGMADPRSMSELMGEVVELAGDTPVILHLHDTEGRGLANALAAIQSGVRVFDTAFGGMGGCPFIKGATGNIATEDLVAMVERMGMTTGIDIRAVAEISRSMEAFFDKRFPGSMHRVLGNDQIKVVL